MVMNVRCFQRNFCSALPPLVPVQLPSKLESHLWYVLPDEVTSTSLLNQYMQLLSPSEKLNVDRMRGDNHRKGALLARALVRTTIARYQTDFQVDPKSLRFRRNRYGKPEVDWPDDDNCCPPLQLHFNISHTSSLVACGVTVDVPIGVDVEEKQRRLKNNILAFAKRYFSPEEVKILSAISDPDVQRQEFIKLWTLKEAYVKALGRGFSAAPFNTFTIRSRVVTEGGVHHSETHGSEVSEIVVESDDPEKLTNNWEFALLDLAGSHFGAICVKKDTSIKAEASMSMRLTAWKTIPFIEDECVTGTDAVRIIGGLIKQC